MIRATFVLSAWVLLNEYAAAASGYSELVEIYRDVVSARERNPVDGLPDHRAATAAANRSAYEDLRRRFDAIDPAAWPLSRRVDYLLVRSLLDEWDFDDRVVRNRSRNPGHYLDGIGGIPYLELPANGERLARLRIQLRAVPGVLEQAKKNLVERSPALSRITVRNLELDVGVYHGEPQRDVPPEGIIGWFRDLEKRLARYHPELVPDAEMARTALESYRDWLKRDPGPSDALPGVGREALDGYLKNARLVPFTAEQLLVFVGQELKRMQAMLAWERHRNRHLPELEPAGSPEEYARRKEEAERHIRTFLAEERILSVPQDLPDFTEARERSHPWVERPSGKRNFWEEIQYRDPRPDLLHTLLPGHAFDDWVRKGPTPIRENFRDRAGREGWSLYVEEMLLRVGLFDHLPRSRELILTFLIARAARCIVNVKLQLNDFTVPDGIGFLVANVPFNSEDGYRIDAELYDMLRRPTYAIDWYVGKVQIDRLVADRSRQLGSGFDLLEFHDAFLAAGTIPVALARWEMTGFDDEVQILWDAEPRSSR